MLVKWSFIWQSRPEDKKCMRNMIESIGGVVYKDIVFTAKVPPEETQPSIWQNRANFLLR